MGTGPTISVIIPTVNEAHELPETLRRVRAIPEVGEIIVVDGGSTDTTCDIAREHNCVLIKSKPSRGHQLRIGAEQAAGEIVLLLHADTWLPENAGCEIIACLGKPLVVAGGFHKTYRDDKGYIPFTKVIMKVNTPKCSENGRTFFIQEDEMSKTNNYFNLESK